MRKKILIACILAVMALCGGVAAWAAPPELQSESVCLMDADTGEVLYEKNADEQRPMASITKVMTALLVLENGDLDATVTVTADALADVDLDSTRVGFEEGEVLTVDELMYCMLVASANDAANILAEYIGGDVDTFVGMMNAKAEELGCTNTHFANPNGLDTDGHYSCAHDMALITYAANQYEQFASYSSTESYTLPADNVISEGWQIWTLVNMIRKDDETYDARVYAAKTGWTTTAKNTFVACGRSGSTNLIVTLLGCQLKTDLFADTTALLDYGEQAYEQQTVSVDDYSEQAQAAANAAGYRIDTDALESFTLRLPSDIDADDLTYTFETTDSGALLHVGIARSSRKVYAAATGMDGSQTIKSITLSVLEKIETVALQVDSTSETKHSSSWLDFLKNPPGGIVGRIFTVVIVVLGAMVLLIVLLFLLGLYRHIKKRRAKRRARRRARRNGAQHGAAVRSTGGHANSAARNTRANSASRSRTNSTSRSRTSSAAGNRRRTNGSGHRRGRR